MGFSNECGQLLMNKIFNVSCIATAFTLLFPIQGISTTNEELGAILAKSDMDVKFPGMLASM